MNVPGHRWIGKLADTMSQAGESMLGNRARSILAVSGVVVGIVTVVLVASVLANLRNQVALLFRELGTDNVFAFHLSGDPYSPPSEVEASRRPLEPRMAAELARLANSIREVAVQGIVPTVVGSQALTARSGGNESDTILVEGVSANYFDVVGAEFRAGRPFTELENRAAARVAVIGSSLATALYGGREALGRTLVMAGETYVVVGELAPRRGGFFGENRQNNVLAIPLGTAQRRFPEADRNIFYMRARPGQREQASLEAEFILRQLRGLRPNQEDDFNLSTADSIIRSLDAVSAQIGLATLGLAAMSLIIGGIGIANVMIIAVTERTREIGLRLAVGARRREVLAQFLFESAFLAGVGGVAGVGLAISLGFALKLVLTGFSAVPPLWAVWAGVATAVAVGMIAGFWPARQAARLDPVEALRHE